MPATDARALELAAQSRVMRALQPHAGSTLELERGAVYLSNESAYAGETGAVELLNLTMRRGREAAGEPAAAGTVTFSYVATGPDDLDRYQIGDRLWFKVSAAALRYLLDVPWSGSFDSTAYLNGYDAHVVDAALEYRTQGRGVPPVAVVRVTCTGPKARAGQVRIGDTPWSQETLSARRNRIYSATGPKAYADYALKPLANWGATSDGSVVVAARDADAANPIDLLESLAGDVGANLSESIRHPGRVLWESIDTRASRTPLVELTPDEIAATATWGLSLAGLVNRYSVEYGPPGARATVTVEDTESISRYGEYAGSRSTELVNLADAQRLAAIMVGRNSTPRWTVTRFDVDLLDLALPKAKAAELVGKAEIGSLLELVGLPVTAPAGRYFFVEGTDLELTRHDWRLTLYVSEADRTAAPMRWEELPPALTWAETDPTRTWLRAAGWFETPPLVYRWTDVPADVAWWQLAPGETRPDGDARAPTWTSYPDDPA